MSGAGRRKTGRGTPTTIAKRISAAEGQSPEARDRGLLDSAAKGLTATRYMLAWIVKYCVREAAGLTIEDIAEKCIEPDIMVSAMPVYREDAEAESADAGSADPGSARLESVEDASILEGVVRYDILFRLKLPGEPDPVTVIINIELQNRTSLPYPLESRAISYGCRLVGRQGAEYTNLNKVYSIWIVSSPGQAAENSTVICKITRSVNGGAWEPVNPDSDLMEIIFLNLGDPDEAYSRSAGYGDLLELLDTLFSSTISVDSKKKTLRDKFGIPMTKEMNSDVETMTALQFGFEERAQERGHVEGRAEGRVEGRAEGRVEGRVEGTIETARLFVSDINDVAKALQDALHITHEEAIRKIHEYDEKNGTL